MLPLPVWASMLLGLLAGFLPVVGMEPATETKSASGHAPDSDPRSSGSNCSQLTLKLEFSSKVVEHGEETSQSARPICNDLFTSVCMSVLHVKIR